MPWTQVYAPIGGSLGWSAIAAAVPITDPVQRSGHLVDEADALIDDGIAILARQLAEMLELEELLARIRALVPPRP